MIVFWMAEIFNYPYGVSNVLKLSIFHDLKSDRALCADLSEGLTVQSDGVFFRADDLYLSSAYACGLFRLSGTDSGNALGTLHIYYLSAAFPSPLSKDSRISDPAERPSPHRKLAEKAGGRTG